MDTINRSVLQCHRFGCMEVPNIEFTGNNGHNIKVRLLVCIPHIKWGRDYLKTNYRGFVIKEERDSKSLLDEQRTILKGQERKQEGRQQRWEDIAEQYDKGRRR